jgi:hypothetical protein
MEQGVAVSRGWKLGKVGKGFGLIPVSYGVKAIGGRSQGWLGSLLTQTPVRVKCNCHPEFLRYVIPPLPLGCFL